MGIVNRWELTSASGVGMLLPFSVIYLGGCKSLGEAAPAVVLCLRVSGSTAVFAVGSCYAVGLLIIFTREAGCIAVRIVGVRCTVDCNYVAAVPLP